MARLLIRQAHGGETRIIFDGALPFFLNQGYVVLDELDDQDDDPPLYLSRAEGDLRWLKIEDWAGGGGYTDEQVRDVVGTTLVAGSNVTITPNDVANTVTISATGGGGITANVMLYEDDVNAARPDVDGPVLWVWPEDPPNSDDTQDFTLLVSEGGGTIGSTTTGTTLPPERIAMIPQQLVGQSAAGLPANWTMVMSRASFLDTPSMGILKTLGAPANALEIEYDGINPVVEDDGTIICATGAPATAYRSEVIFTSDRTDGSSDYTIMRFHAGDRIRLAFDVLTAGMNAQDSAAWNSVFQSLGKAVNNSFPSSPLALLVENKKWVIRGGAAITVAEPPSSQTAHEDGRWYRWEFDILLGGPTVGKVSAWCDAVPVATNWFPPSGTYYAGNSNTALDLQWIYFKLGLYGGATTTPNLPKAIFRNRRFSATVGGVTTTWRGPHTSGPGMKIYTRNPTTDMPY